jgi:hypothetical protein
MSWVQQSLCIAAMTGEAIRTHSTRTKTVVAFTVLSSAVALAACSVALRHDATRAAAAPEGPSSTDDPVEARRRADFDALRTHRPGYAFWRHVFTLPDHSIAYGSAVDGRLLVTFPANGDWTRRGVWTDPALADVLKGERLSRRRGDRREQVARLLERAAGPVLHNSTRGDALLQSVPAYGSFVGEWSAIYQRFGVPGDIGLAQAILESGMSGTRRSEANAVGFCQWLHANWKRLNYFSAVPLQAQNQTTQAAYCAAYLSVLATKYGSFIPAVSEHNAGGTNVGRTLINGERLGAGDVRAQYLEGSQLANDLRALPGSRYAALYQSYGPRSYRYAEMVFGIALEVDSLIASNPQEPIHAMRAPRVISLGEIMKRTRLSAKEVRRYNPALGDRVPARAALYLPSYVSEFGPDVAFWRRPASAEYAAALDSFVRLRPGAERWDDRAFAPVLADFKRRFEATNTEEGMVMATVLAYAMDQAYTSPRHGLVTKFRHDERVRRLVDRAVLELASGGDARHAAVMAASLQ